MPVSHSLLQFSVVAGGPFLLAIAAIPIVGGQDAAPALPVPRELRTYVFRLTGADPLDCGQHLLNRPFVGAGSEQPAREHGHREEVGSHAIGCRGNGLEGGSHVDRQSTGATIPDRCPDDAT